MRLILALKEGVKETKPQETNRAQTRFGRPWLGVFDIQGAANLDRIEVLFLCPFKVEGLST
jgi:hypothetical protein